MSKIKHPSNWIERPLKDFIILKNGYAFDSNSYQEQGIPVVRISDITTEQQVSLDNTVCVADKPDYQNFIISKGDLLLAMSGATTGKLGIYSENTKIFQNQRVGNLKIINTNICDSKFRNYLFFSLSNTILKLAYGGAQPNISGARLLSLSCVLPPLAEQKRIVKKIEELFGIIDKTVKYLNDTKQHLAQYRQSVLQQAFSGKLHKTTVWSQNSLNDLCKYIQRGKSPKYITHSTLPVINQKCIRWNELQIQYLKFIDPVQFESWIRERHVQPMDILWNSTGTGTIGRAYLYQGTELEDAVVDSHVTIVRADAKKINPNFLFFYIQSPFIQRKIEKMQSGSTNQVELARKEIQNIQVNLPSLPEQKAIVAKIETAFAAADKAERAISAALEQAKQFKQSILKRAFEGKLVPQDPNDEPVDLSQLNTHKGKSK